ncbi:MAG: hypothetical protein H6727_00455 [Myxococcales bacterium]|nr:hypothetical protein [Myxococcales bacterium]
MMNRPTLRTLCSVLALMVICLVGFRCGTLAEDCLEDSDCSAVHRCVRLRCLLISSEEVSPETSPEESITDGGIPESTVEPTIEAQEPVVEIAPCSDGETRSCYEGPDGTLGKGPCKAGTQRCEKGYWGLCIQQVTPRIPRCDGGDRDCDGEPDRCRLGAWCDGGLMCESGLTCHQNRCLTTCDPKDGITNNPACSFEGSSALCFATSPTEGVCKRECSSRKSSPFDDPNCAVGTYCVERSDAYAPGFCAPTAPPARGKRVLGQTCSKASVEDDCDGDLALACVLDGTVERCLDACDPHQGSTGCPSGKLCQGTNLSFLGGVCRTP